MEDQKCMFDVLYGETKEQEMAATRELEKTGLKLQMKSTVNQLRQRDAEYAISYQQEFRKVKTGNFSLTEARRLTSERRRIELEIDDIVKMYVYLFNEPFE